MKRRHTLLLVLLIFCVVAVAAYLFIKQNIDRFRPTIKVSSVTVRNIDSDKINMLSRVVLNNSSPVDLNSAGLRYSLSINGTTVMKNELKKAIELKAGSSAEIELPVVLLPERIKDALAAMKSSKTDTAAYSIDAELDVVLPVVGSRTFSINETKRLPEFQLLEIKVKDVDVESFRLKNTGLSASVEVKNPNLFPIKFKDATYRLTFDKEFVLASSIEGVTVIAPRSVERVPLEIQVKNKEMLKLASQALFNKDGDKPFSLEFKCDVVSKDPMLSSSTMQMTTNGTLNDIRDIKEIAKK